MASLDHPCIPQAYGESGELIFEAIPQAQDERQGVQHGADHSPALILPRWAGRWLT